MKTHLHTSPIVVNMAGMTVFNVAGYLIEERRIWPVTCFVSLHAR